MTHPNNIPDVEPIHQLLTSYSFDAEDYPTEAMIVGWLEDFGAVWVSHAITEALYQGRYKVISIDQILKLWQRRGQPIRHFNREFESIILGQSLLCPTGYGDGAEPSSIRRALPAIAPTSLGSGADQPPQVDASLGPSEPYSSVLPGAAATDSPPEANTAGSEPSQPDLEASDEPAIAPASIPGIPNFRPLPAEASSLWHQADMIQPFVPRRDRSELHERLRAVVQGGMEE
ncbi:hypothetical protein VB780_18470 [Leptolyngbya sp. CCNP1308]|uniref:hypothetical protein n=1 Tax=Leptolyngbya sp. CCNP1308 TaxID=3110255 RepID=UPI002B1EFDE5|nr:hypothetical protein [Leptolyngbya sp. CCNP1308]MEA5450570.1 hypothetical protein [Leptolyngbya sp. CCNP1308]